MIYKSTYQRDEESYSTLKYVEKFYPEWLNHMSSGNYQTNINTNRCEKIWANIGDLLIAKKYTWMKNDGVN